MTGDSTSRRLRVAVTTGPVRIPPTYFVVNHLLQMDRIDGRLFALAAQVDDPEVARLVSTATAYGVPGLRGVVSTTAAVPRLRRAIKRFAPDLVHQHFGTWSLAGSGAAKALGVPFIATLHGYDVFRFSDRVHDYWTWATARNLRACAERATSLLAVSEWLAGEAIRRGFPASKIDVHYQGVDTDFFTPVPGFGAEGFASVGDVGDGSATQGSAPDGDPCVLFVGGLEARKGVLDAVEASIALAQRRPHTLRIIGAGRQEAQVRSAIVDHPHITLEGLTDRSGVRAAMRAANVFIMPTQRDGQWREAAGLVTVEAQACGVPVVVYESGGAPEMFEDGVTGVLVPEGDTYRLAGAVDDLLTLSVAEYGAMSAAARTFAVNERSTRVSVAQLQERYKALVGGGA